MPENLPSTCSGGCCRSNTLCSDPAPQHKPSSQLSETVFIRLWKTTDQYSTCARCSFPLLWSSDGVGTWACLCLFKPTLLTSLPPYFCFPLISVLPLQIFMRYGRQRWKLKGKIEANSRQSWDGEEMIFMPLITDLISIKVQLKILCNKYP